MTDLAKGTRSDPVRVSLTRFLLFQASNSQQTGKQWTVFEIAAHLGAQRGAIIQTLQVLVGEGLIRREPGRLVVTDVARLEHKAMSSKSEAEL